MDLSRFFVDTALSAGLAAADLAAAVGAADAYRSVFYERLLAGLFENNENLFVTTDIRKDRAPIFVLPALYWLSRKERPAQAGKALYLCADEAAALAAYEAARAMAEVGGLAAPGLLRAETAGGTDEPKNAALLFAAAQAFYDALAAGVLTPRDYGFVIADQAELIAELPGETTRKIQGSLLPSWERKSLVIADKHTPRAKNFAWDFSDNPKETKLGEAMGYADTTATFSFNISEADKIRYVLSLLRDGADRHLCLFCNLKSTAAELSARLAMNGVAADYIGGNLNPDRKNQIATKALTWRGAREEREDGEPRAEGAPQPEGAVSPPEGAAVPRFPADSFVLVLTDEGAKNLNRPEFLNVVNYDIPLEPEHYFERLNFLKRQDTGARLHNLVCDRYMYGIPEIQRLLGASFDLKPLDPGFELPEDLSAGRQIEMPEPRFRGRGGRRGDDRDGRDRRDRRDRGDDRDDRSGRDSRDNRDRGRRYEAGDRLSRGERRGGYDSPENRKREPRAENRPGAADFYALSMEERLAMYKKKYGGRIGAEDSPTGPEGSRGGARSGGARNSGARNSGADRETRRPAAGNASGGPDPKPETPQPRGFLGKLQGFLGITKKHDDKAETK